MHALIVCNGFPPSQQMLKAEVQLADYIIGADGGGNILLAHDVKPDVVIGDMDSFSKRSEHNEMEVIYDADQETNDLEKALSYAESKDVTSCTVLGAFGKRLDHSLKNLSVMMKFDSHFQKLLFKDEYQKAFLVDSFYETKIKIGTNVSLFPITGTAKRITTKGLQYSLNDEELENGLRDGTSNMAIENHISIEVREGALVIFIELENAEML